MVVMCYLKSASQLVDKNFDQYVDQMISQFLQLFSPHFSLLNKSKLTWHFLVTTYICICINYNVMIIIPLSLSLTPFSFLSLSPPLFLPPSLSLLAFRCKFCTIKRLFDLWIYNVPYLYSCFCLNFLENCKDF